MKRYNENIYSKIYAVRKLFIHVIVFRALNKKSSDQQTYGTRVYKLKRNVQ